MYSHNYSIHAEGKLLYEMCYSPQHSLQTSVISRKDKLWAVLVSYDHRGVQGDQLEILAWLQLSNCKGYHQPFSLYIPHYRLGSLESMIREKEFFMYHYKQSGGRKKIYVNWHVGCAVLQNRGSLLRQRHTEFEFVKVFAQMHFVYFESSLAAIQCRQIAFSIIHDHEKRPVEIYPSEINLNRDIQVDKHFLIGRIVLELHHKNHCDHYDASFDATISNYCSDVMGAYLSIADEINDNIWKSFPQPEDQSCGRFSYKFSMDLQTLGVLHCDPLIVQQMNRTLIINVAREDVCLEYLLRDSVHFGPKKAQCADLKTRSCSRFRVYQCYIVLTRTVDKKCPSKCIQNNHIAVKQARGSQILFYNTSSRELTLNIPYAFAQSLFLIQLPTLDSNCHCRISFQSHLRPNYQSFKVSLTLLPFYIRTNVHTFVYRNKKYWVESMVSYTWDEAEKRCRGLNHGHLWSISDEDELWAVLEHHYRISHSHRLLREDLYYMGALFLRIIYIGLKHQKVNAFKILCFFFTTPTLDFNVELHLNQSNLSSPHLPSSVGRPADVTDVISMSIGCFRHRQSLLLDARCPLRMFI